MKAERKVQLSSLRDQPRLHREARTVYYMTVIYCRENHQPAEDLCDTCDELYGYAVLRLGKCPFHCTKPVCNDCEIHCYKPRYREHVAGVMRFSGPRMMWRHPILAIRHLIDQRRNPPRQLGKGRNPGPKSGI